MRHSMVCIVSSLAVADSIVAGLKVLGFNNNDISVLFSDNMGSRDIIYVKHSKASTGTSVGAGSGAVLGGTLGWLAGVGILTFPGIGPFVAAGPLLAALSGVAVGGTVGGIAGGLLGLGIPEYVAKQYEGKIRGGNILISIHCDDAKEADLVERILENHGARDVSRVVEEPVKIKPIKKSA